MSEKAMQDRARRAAKRVGLRATKARGSRQANNLRGSMLVDVPTNSVFRRR